jgi:2'-5' RNA ligase
MNNDTSLIIPVAEAAFLQPFRAQYLQRPGVTMPPHITIRPLQRLPAITADDHRELSALCASLPSFEFRLTHNARFREIGVLYLAPEPTEPFLKLYQALRNRFPEPPDKHPSVVFHLTLAGHHPSDLDSIEAAFDAAYRMHVPIHAVARELRLYARHDQRWVETTTYAFGPALCA